MSFFRFFSSKRKPIKKAQSRAARLVLEALEDRTLLSVNPIVAENALPGTPESVWEVGAGDPSILGFATNISVDHGQTVSFKIDDYASAPYHIDIYRMGYYQGNGARLITSLSESQVIRQVQPAPLTDNTTGLVDAGNWAVSASWAVPSTAVSGIYMARVTRDDTGGASMIYFVVRDDEDPSTILFQTSDSTWEAYNNWDGTGNGKTFFSAGGVYGGVSLYTYNGNNSTLSAYGRATEVSYNRPLVDDATVGGFGSYDSPMHAEYPMVRWLEENGYDVSYTTDVDSARNGNLILNHEVFLSVGHDEYWSGPQRTNVQAAINAGVNVAFFSGNEAFWKIRWQASLDSSATAYRTLVCYKQSYPNAPLDPLDQAPTWTWTGTWRDINGGAPADAGIPENAMTGTMYMTDRTNVDLGIPLNVPAVDANLRFWRNTSVASLQAGQTATLGQFIVGYETDSDIDNGFRPAGLFDMSATTFTTASLVQDQSGTVVGNGTSTQEITLYRAASGALVFGAGTVQWSWGLDGHHNDTPSTPDPAIQQATVNLLADMNAQPATLQAGLVPATASTDVTPPTSVITSPTTGANLTIGSTVTITGTATDVGGVVAGVEVSVDGGQTWHRAVLGSGAARTVSWSYSWVPTTPGPVILMSRATDDSANLEIPSAGVKVNVSYQPTSTTGLVAAYAFNEGSGTTVADASGHGNTGTISGATWTSGLYGQALSFNGTNSWVTINDSTSLHLTTGMTLEAWVKPTAAASNWTAVMIKERTGGLAYGMYATDGANQPPAGYIDTSNTDNDSKGLSLIPVNAWSFLSVTYDGSNLDLYVNGTLVNTLAVSGSIISSTGALRIGGDSIWGEYFQGLIDNIRIYNRPLNVGEIRSDMNTPVGGSLETTPPTGSLTGPANGAVVSGVTTVSASVSDNVMVASVQYLLNGVNLGSAVTAAPFSLAWDTRKYANGTYTLSAVVSDFAGNTTTLSSVTVTVNNSPDTTPPTVQILNPVSSLVHGTIVPWAFASDNIGVVSVQFQLNGVNIGAALTGTPYRFAWDTTKVADGTYTLTAVARDAAGNVTTSSPVSVTIDNTPPQVTGETPPPGSTGVATSAPGITATFSEAVQLGTVGALLKDSSGRTLDTGLTYDSSTNTLTITPTGVLEPSTTYTVTISGAQDLAGNTMSPASWSFTTTSTVVNASLWGPTDTPVNADAPDNSAQELGVKFTSDIAGFITGIRFYKGATNTGTHVGHLWTSTGTLLATVTFTNETATGWQQVFFSQPVAIQPNTTYIVSYLAPAGNYAYDSEYFATAGVDAGVLHALPNSSGGNGVYGAAGAFPTNNFNATNYWVDVVFSNVLVPVVIGTTPAAGATGVSTTAPNITATFSKPVVANTISFVLTDAGGNAVPATLSYNATTSVATLTPSVALAASATYTATVSGAQDSSGQTITPLTWSFTTATPDTTPPTVTAETPTPGTTLATLGTVVTATFNKPVVANTISFVLKDAGGNVVAAAVSYNSATNTVTLTPANLAPLATYTATLSGARDLAGNTMAPVSWSFTMAPQITGVSLWNGAAPPAVTSSTDTTSQELGVKFTSDTGGYITGLMFYKGPGNTGTHTAHLWTSTGVLLASATFTSETASGWQEVSFPTPVAIQANTVYVASYFDPNGDYSYTTSYFASAGTDSGVLHALSNTAGGGNGVFAVGSASTFPNGSFSATNYWVDVVFSNSLVPTVVATTPAANAGGVSATAPNITATFNEDVEADEVSFTLRDGAGNPVAATVTWQPELEDLNESVTLILTPHSALIPFMTYTATISGAVDANGNTMAGPYSWSFTPVPITPITDATIWGPAAVPTIASANDSTAQELGVKFTSDVDGYITGIRFYKGVGNTGTHVGHLWGADGTLLATATFTSETATGWQQVNFSQPVAIQAGTTYIASYYAPNGHYAYNSAYFTSGGADNGVLHALSNVAANGNGVYSIGSLGIFPKSTFNSTNYWVDVVFSNTLTPVVTATAPAANSLGASTNPIVTATFSGPMDPTTITTSTFYLVAAGSSTVVPATVSYSGTTATLIPNAPLALNTAYQATLVGTIADPNGHSLGVDYTWSFTTQVNPNFTDTTVADFSAGTPDANAAVVQMGDGEVILNPSIDDEFSGSALPADWTSTSLGTGSTAVVSSGQLTLDGVRAGTSALYSLGSGRSLEFMATFSGDAFQHIGLGTDLSSAPWAIFSTDGGGALYARTNNGTTSTETLLPGNWLGAPHDFRIDWTPSGVTYWIDGTVVASHAIAITANMRPLVVDTNVGGGTVSVDWMRLTPFAASGSFLSRVFDAGTAVTWLDAAWADTVPTGANLTLSVRMGNTPTPDATWTDFIPLASSGATIGGSARYIQYRVNLTTSALGQTPVLQAVTLDYTANPDTIPPSILSISPANGGVQANPTGQVVVKFDELMNGATINGSTIQLFAVGSSTPIPATVSYVGSTAILTPTATLLSNTQYQVVISGGITDSSGNPLGGNTTATFTTGYLTVTDTTTTDFAAGTVPPRVYVSQMSDGEVILAPVMGSEFLGTTLPQGWSTVSWASGGAATVANALLSLDGAAVYTAPFSSGSSVQFEATFSGDPYQHVGFFSPGLSAPWAIFSTGPSGGALYAYTSNGASSTDTLLSGNWLGTSHIFRIDWTSTGVVYYIDGVQVAAHNITIGTGMELAASDLNVGSGALTVNWMHLAPYAPSGTFVSRVIDAGTAVTWNNVSWTGNTPAGTTIALSVRMGNTPTPDATWTSWIPLSASGATVGGSARYFQYEAALTSTNSFVTPDLDSVTVSYAINPDTIPPTVLNIAIAGDTTGADPYAPVTVAFSELMNASSITAATIRLRAVGGSSDVPAVVTYAGSTATLTPLAPLSYGTTYQVTVAGAVVDSSGNPLGSNVTSTFTTAPVIDTTSPTVTASSPSSGATGVARATDVTATFSEQVQASTASFVLKDAAGNTIPALVSYNVSTRTLTLSPNANLAPSTTYTVNLSGALDLAGNMMAPTSWTFTTAAADVTAPTVVSQTPVPNASGVVVGSNITATFSEVVQSHTISFILTTGSTTVSAAVTYDPSTRTVTLDPNTLLTAGTTYTATLSGTQDLSANVMAPVSWTFTTAVADTTSPTIIAQTPASGATAVPVGTTLTAMFSKDVLPSTVSFVLKTGSTTIPAALSYDAASRTATLTPSANLSLSTTYTATVSGAQDLSGNTMTPVSWSFTTSGLPDTTPPTVASNSPVSGATGVTIGSNVTATFSEDVQVSTLSFTLKNGSTTIPAIVTYDAPSRTVTLDPTGNLAPSTTYTVTLSGAQDLSGNTMTTTSWSFTTAAAVDSTAPTVSSRTPASGATGVTIGSNVTATFSEAIQASTLSATLMTGSTSVPVIVTYDAPSHTVTLDPTGNLIPSTTYTVTLSGAQDLSGNTMTITSWTFTTAAASDSTPPTVSSRSPASGATGVAVGSNMTATFSEAVQANTISFTLAAGSTTVPVVMTYDAPSHTATLDPTGNLAPSTTYTVTLSGAQDLSGNTMTTTSWSFTTAAADTTAPTVSSRTPASGATGVSVATTVTATFSEAVQANTISFTLLNGSTTVATALTYEAGSQTVTLDPSANLAPSTTYTATLSGAQDLSGNTMTTTSWSFTTAAADTTAPTVTGHTPASGATAVPADTSVTATFSEPVQRGTISFTLKNGSTTVSSTVSYDPTTRMVSLDPSATLSNSTTYTATLSGAQDLAGNVMSTLTWTFTTAAAPSSPFVSSRSPVPNAIGFVVGNSITATFNTSMNSSSITSSTFVLRDSSNNVVSASVSYSSGTRTATLKPNSNLTAGATYTVTLSGVKDSSNNTMATTSWSFTTAGTADTTAPTVSSRTPASGATSVSVATHVTATFSEDVQATTITFTLKNGSTTVPVAMSYDASSRTVTLDPNANLAPSTTYTATLSGAQDLSGNTMTTTSWNFSTAAADTTAPTVTSHSPASGATGVTIGSNVTATFSEDVQASTITFTLKNGTTTVPVVVTYDAPSRTATLDPTGNLAPSTTYTVTLSGVQDLSGNTMTTTSWTFTTAAASDSTPPTVTSHSPASGATGVTVGSNVTATFSEDVQASTITFTLKNGTTTVPVVVTYDAPSRTATLDPTGNLAPSTTYTVTLSGVQDLSGNTMTTTSWTFTTAAASDSTPPTVTSHSPASGATGVTVGSNVTATFSEDVQASTLSVTLTAGSTTVPAIVTYDAPSRTVTLDPTGNLAPSTTYTVTLSGAQDLSGNTMTTTSWSFTTAAADTTAPTVTAQTPASGATGVTIGSNVTATFSEAIQASTLTFTLKNGTGSAVAATVTYDAAGRTVTLHPNANLAYATTYTATLSGAQDLSGNTMTTTSWTFTTGAAPGTTLLSIIAQSPASGATGLAVSTNVTATFNEAIQTNSLNLVLVDSGNNPVAALVTYDVASRTVTLDPNANLAPATTYTVTVSGAEDLYGNTMTTTSWSFTTAVADVTPPTLTAANPASGTTNVAASTNMTATFSKDVQASTIGFVLVDSGNNPVAAVVTYDAASRTATLHPNANLAPATTYTVTVSGAQDVSGNTMNAVSWSFTTAAADVTPPTLTAVSPASGAANVALNSTVSATFSERVQSATLNFVLRDGSNNVVPATVSYNWVTQTVTLTPSAPLPDSTTYTATLSGVEDLAGNVMPTLSWSFATADTTAPSVTAVSPAAGATQVAITSSVTATFSEAVQPTTLNFVLRDASNNLVPATVSYNAGTRTVTLVPISNLAYGTTYTVTLSGAQDLAGNTMTALSWSFTTGTQQWVQTTAADFSAGTQSGTTVTNTSGGAVQLAPQFFDDFAGTALSSSWTTTATGGGTASVTVSSGVLSVLATEVDSTQTYSNVAIEGSLDFGAAPYQHFGLATSLSSVAGNYWALFSTAGTSNTLFARVNVNGTTQDVSLGALPTGFHDYLIKPVSGGFQFLVDGVAQTTITAAFPNGTALKIVLSDYTGTSQAPLQADWIRISSYPASGTFTSSVFDATQIANWGAVSWTANLPAGTSVSILTRSGNTATPDSSWSAWTALSNTNQVQSGSARYLQYEVILTTTDPTVTPTLLDITFNWT